MSTSLIPDIVSVIAGVCFGAILGAISSASLETKKRGATARKINPFERVSVKSAIAIMAIVFAFSIILVGTYFLIVAGSFFISGANVSGRKLGLIFGVAIVIGAAVTKCLRYLIWRSWNKRQNS